MVRLVDHLCPKRLLSRKALYTCTNAAIENDLTEVTAMLLDYRHTMEDTDELML